MIDITDNQFKETVARQWTMVCYHYSSFESYLKEVHGLTDSMIDKLYPEEDEDEE